MPTYWLDLALITTSTHDGSDTLDEVNYSLLDLDMIKMKLLSHLHTTTCLPGRG